MTRPGEGSFTESTTLLTLCTMASLLMNVHVSKFDNTSHHGQEEISMGLLARSIRGGGLRGNHIV